MGSGPFGTGSIRAHVADTDPHGDRAFAENLIDERMSAHEALRNPHGLLLSDLLPVYTWATLPSAAANNGLRVHVSDVGEGGSDWKSNGTLWLPVNGSVLLARSGTQASVTGTTAETALATIAIRAGIMGTNGQLRVTTLWSLTNNANAKTCRVRLGGISGTVFQGASIASAASWQGLSHIRNRNSASQQVSMSAGPSISFSTSTSAVVTATIDTAQAQDLVLSGQLGNSADTITLESYTVELLR